MITEFTIRPNKNLRELGGWSQTEMYCKLSIPQNTISQYEDGSRMPNVKRLILLADFFGVSLDYLVGRD